MACKEFRNTNSPSALGSINCAVLMTVLSYDLSCILNLPFQSVTWQLYPKTLLTSVCRTLNNLDEDFSQEKNVQFIQMSCQPQDTQLIKKKKQQQLLTLEGVRLGLGAGIQTSRYARWARDYNQPTNQVFLLVCKSLVWCPLPSKKSRSKCSWFNPKPWTSQLPNNWEGEACQ